MLFVDLFLKAFDLCTLVAPKATSAFIDDDGNEEGKKVAWDSIKTDYSQHFYNQACISQLVCGINEVYDTIKKHYNAELWDQSAIK